MISQDDTARCGSLLAEDLYQASSLTGYREFLWAIEIKKVRKWRESPDLEVKKSHLASELITLSIQMNCNCFCFFNPNHLPIRIGRCRWFVVIDLIKSRSFSNSAHFRPLRLYSFFDSFRFFRSAAFHFSGWFSVLGKRKLKMVNLKGI